MAADDAAAQRQEDALGELLLRRNRVPSQVGRRQVHGQDLKLVNRKVIVAGEIQVNVGNSVDYAALLVYLAHDQRSISKAKQQVVPEGTRGRDLCPLGVDLFAWLHLLELVGICIFRILSLTAEPF